MGKGRQTNRKVNISSILFCIVFLFNHVGFAQKVESSAYQFMLNSLLSKKVATVSVADIQPTDEIVWLDAREKKEFEVSHLKDAIWVGYETFDLKNIEHLPKNSNIIVYCSVGYRSEKITEKLIDAGFVNVKNLFGGIFEWVNQNKPVFKENITTNQVHAYSKTWGIWLHKGEKVFD